MHINFEDIIRYNICPMSYYFFKNKNIISIDDEYYKKLYQAIFFMFNKFNISTSLNFQEIKDFWISLWLNNESMIEHIFNPLNKYKKNKERSGIFILSKLWDLFINDNYKYLSINFPFKINYKNIVLHGSFPIIRESIENKKTKINLLGFHKFYNNGSDRLYYNLDITFMALAYKLLVNDNFNITIIHLNPNKIKITNSERDNKDYNMLFNTIRGICKGIQNNVFYRRYSRKCTYCAYYKYCHNE